MGDIRHDDGRETAVDNTDMPNIARFDDFPETDEQYGNVERQQPGGATIVSAQTGMQTYLAASGRQSAVSNDRYLLTGRSVTRIVTTQPPRKITENEQRGYVPQRKPNVFRSDSQYPNVISEVHNAHTLSIHKRRSYDGDLNSVQIRRETYGGRVVGPHETSFTQGPGSRYVRLPSYTSLKAPVGRPVNARYDIHGSYGQSQMPPRRIPPNVRWSNVPTVRAQAVRIRRPPIRPVIFDHEANEAEDRAIAEAIAREEELMRLEEEREMEMSRSVDADFQRIEEEILRKEAAARQELESKRLSAFRGPTAIYNAHVSKAEQVTNSKVQQLMEKPSNLTLQAGDTEDEKVCKMIMDGVLTQVTKWDRQYGWHKNVLKKMREKRGWPAEMVYINASPVVRNTAVRQIEPILTDAVERLKKEINKRRLKLELDVENEIGHPSPWRKGKSRFVRTQNPTAPVVPLEPVDPATISLFDDFSSSPTDEKEKTEPVQCAEIKPTNEYDHEESSKKPLKVVSPTRHSQRLQQKSPTRSVAELMGKRGANRRTKKRTKDDELSEGEEAEQGHDAKQSRDWNKADSIAMSFKDESKKGGDIDVNGRHCYCNRPYNAKKFYVACDVCYKWFHGKCIGITEKKAQKMDSWVCRECEKSVNDEEDLYCVCRQPYDQKKFYVGCDGCEGWFHPECVGTTQSAIEGCKQYYCPECRSAQSGSGMPSTSQQASTGYESSSSATSLGTERADYTMLWKLLESLTAHETSWPFRENSSTSNNELVDKPMDLALIREKLEQRSYRHLKDFASDVCQIFENARRVHSSESQIWKCSEALEKRFREDLMSIKEEIDQRQQRVSECPTTTSLDIDSDTLFGFGTDINLDPFMLHEFL